MPGFFPWNRFDGGGSWESPFADAGGVDEDVDGRGVEADDDGIGRGGVGLDDAAMGRGAALDVAGGAFLVAPNFFAGGFVDGSFGKGFTFFSSTLTIMSPLLIASRRPFLSAT